MIADHANTYSQSVPHPFTLNDLRVHNVYEEEPAHSSILTRSAMVLAAVLAIGAFVWLDPLRLFTPAEEKTPPPAAVATAQPAQPPVTQEIAPPVPPPQVPATKSAEVPITPASTVRASPAPAPVVRSTATASKPQSGGRPADKINSTVARAPLEEKTAPPIVMTAPEERTPTPAPSASPEEKANPPIVPKPGDDANSAPKPAAASAPTPATE